MAFIMNGTAFYVTMPQWLYLYQIEIAMDRTSQVPLTVTYTE